MSTTQHNGSKMQNGNPNTSKSDQNDQPTPFALNKRIAILKTCRCNIKHRRVSLTKHECRITFEEHTPDRPAPPEHRRTDNALSLFKHDRRDHRARGQTQTLRAFPPPPTDYSRPVQAGDLRWLLGFVTCSSNPAGRPSEPKLNYGKQLSLGSFDVQRNCCLLSCRLPSRPQPAALLSALASLAV